MAKAAAAPLKILLSSTVYGKETLIDQAYAMLKRYGYKVWNSHVGTLPIMPGANTYDTCIAAVEQCDLFIGLISPNYGTGTDGAGGDSITHRELTRAIELGKPRFMLAHEQVVLARRLLIDVGFDTAEKRKVLPLKRSGSVINDVRLIEMYEAATQEGVPIAERTDNWVQKYRNDADVLLFVEEQFSRYDDLKAMIERNAAAKGAAQ